MVTGFDVAWSTLVKAPTGGSYTTCPDCGKKYQGAGPCPFCNTPGGTVSDIAKGGGPRGGPRAHDNTARTKDFQAADRRALAPKSLNQGGHLSGPAMSDQDWDFHEGYGGYGGADRRNNPDEDYDSESDWADKPYEDEDEEQVYGKYLAEQRQKERQQTMDRGIPDPKDDDRKEPLPHGYEYENDYDDSFRRVPPEIPTNPFRKAWDSLTRKH